MKKAFKALLLNSVLFFSIYPSYIQAENSTSALNGYTLTLGFAMKELSFDYYRSDNDIFPAGSMTEGMYPTYFFRAGSPYVLSENKKWGFYFEAGFSNFSMSKQNVGNDEIDLGTSVDGNYWYITPIGFYLFGPVPKNKDELSVITGIGLGPGYVSARGNMILTEDGSNELLKVDTQGVDLAVSILIEARYGKWVSRIYGGGPFLTSNSSTYSAFDFTWDFGYIFTF